MVLANGSVMVAECDPVYDAGAIVGAVVRFRSGAAGSSRAHSAASHADRPLSGWESLTETERSVASLVAEGYTNREAARGCPFPGTPSTPTSAISIPS